MIQDSPDVFVASNDTRVWMNAIRGVETSRHSRKSGSPVVRFLAPRQVQALREFFQVERDEELGRWRDPEAPEMVVYKLGNLIRVLDESLATSIPFSWRGQAESDLESASDLVRRAAASALRYYDAHPHTDGGFAGSIR